MVTMSGSNRGATAVTVICFGGWIIGVWAMGLFALQMGAPIIFPLFAFGMGCIPILFFAFVCRSKKKFEQQVGIQRYRDDTIVYTGDYQLDSEPESKEPEKVYLIPAECPTCLKPISDDVVDWVGPLKAKCPYCETIIEAKEKRF
jgi:hypothetical protein